MLLGKHGLKCWAISNHLTGQLVLSVSVLPALRGLDLDPLREAPVHHSINGSFAIRHGDWKLAPAPTPAAGCAPRRRTREADGLPPVQLYNLATDPADLRNVQDKHPEVAARLTGLLEKYVDDGPSTPGPRRKNDGKMVQRKRVKPTR